MAPAPAPAPSPPSFFPTYALDQAFAGIGAGVVSTLFRSEEHTSELQSQ